MRRFGRKLDVEALRAELPLSVFFFDCLLRDGEALVDRGAASATTSCEQSLPQALVTPSLITDDVGRPRRSTTTRWRGATKASWPRRSTRPTKPGAAAPAG